MNAVHSQSRNPPVNALSLSPARVFGGSSLSFLTLPPPMTMSVGCKAPAKASTTLATLRFHRFGEGRVKSASSLTDTHNLRDVPLRYGRWRRPPSAGNHAVNDRGAKLPVEAEEQHSSSLVAAQSLHGRVVDQLDRTSERLFIIKPDPTQGQSVLGFDTWGGPEVRPARIAQRNHVESPSFGSGLLDARDHVLNRHLRAGSGSNLRGVRDL